MDNGKKTEDKAERIRQSVMTVYQLNRKTTLDEEEEFIMMENLAFLAEETKDPVYAEWLGGIYYDKRMFDLALKYYEISEAMGGRYIYNCLGYIWYYGRTGQVDYEKAYNYFSRMAQLPDNGDLEIILWKQEARVKLADMYKNGYYVEKDHARYTEMIEELYEEVADSSYGSRPEVFTRLAAIRVSQGLEEEAADLYLRARQDLICRLSTNRFFGDLNRMNWLVNDLYRLIAFDPAEFDLYDLYYLLKQEHLVTFEYGEENHEIESRLTDEGMAIRFDGKWYRNIDDFFKQAELDGESIESCYYDMDNWEIVR